MVRGGSSEVRSIAVGHRHMAGFHAESRIHTGSFSLSRRETNSQHTDAHLPMRSGIQKKEENNSSRKGITVGIEERATETKVGIRREGRETHTANDGRGDIRKRKKGEKVIGELHALLNLSICFC